MQHESQPQEFKTQDSDATTIRKGSEFTLSGFDVVVHAINLPRLTLNLKNTATQRGKSWNPSAQGQVIEFAGHKFFVKAATGRRLYLIKVDVDESKEG